jgi:hypothetical protein
MQKGQQSGPGVGTRFFLIWTQIWDQVGPGYFFINKIMWLTPADLDPELGPDGSTPGPDFPPYIIRGKEVPAGQEQIMIYNGISRWVR